MPAHSFDTPWRKTTAALFSTPSSSAIYAVKDIDVTEIEAYRQQLDTRKTPSLLHFVIGAVARTIAADVPEINCFVRRGRLYPRPSIDVLVATRVPRVQGLVGVKVTDAHTKSVLEIASAVETGVRQHLRKETGQFVQQYYALSKVPWPFRRWVGQLVKGVTYDFGIPIKRLNLAAETNGSILISDATRFSDGFAFGAITPGLHMPDMLMVNRPQERPVVRDGAIVVRTMLTLSGTFDHRVVDGEHLGRLGDGLARRLQAPTDLLAPPIHP